MKKFSKILTTLLALCMAVGSMASLVACGGGNDSSGKKPPANSGGGNSDVDVHICGHVCPVCGDCLDATCTDPVCAEKCDTMGKTEYRFEAEDLEHVRLKSGIMGSLGVAQESGAESYIGNYAGNVGASVIYTLYAEEDMTVSLYVSVCKRVASSVFTSVVGVILNGEFIERPSIVPGNGSTADTWTEFTDVNLGCVSFQQGKNVIEFMMVAGDPSLGYNFNSISVWSASNVTWWDSSMGEHECEQVCSVCGKCMDDGCTESVCSEKCGQGLTGYFFEGEDDRTILTEGTSGLPNRKTQEAGSAEVYVGNFNANVGASIGFEVEVAAATTATLKVSVCKRSLDVLFTDLVSVKVNGAEISRASLVKGLGGGDTWVDFFTVNLGCISLNAGKNTITFTCISDDAGAGFNFDNMQIYANEVIDWAE